MHIKPPITNLLIRVAKSGFYRGFSTDVTITAKLLVGALILWAIAFPENAASILGQLNSFIMAGFNYWYIYAMAFFVILCFVLALWPKVGKLRLGCADDRPEFSNFSWFSMMFGAGIGIGMLTFATAEPMYHFAKNPSTILGLTEGNTVGNVRDAYVWSFTHWGLAAWGCYSVVGLSLAFYSYRRGLPLTIRSSLAPLFGEKLSGKVGHSIDVVAVVATVLGIAQTLGYGVEQFISGLSTIGVGDWLYTLDDEGNKTTSSAGIITALLIIMGGATISALSGVGKGIKWLSNINMVLSFFVLIFFLIFGSTFFGLSNFFVGIWDYAISVPGNMFTVWSADGTPAGDALSGWQSAWTIFYWAWWIAFAPFVGVFLARISKGRTIREYIFGAMIIPSLMCFIWFALVGGTAIDLELSGVANGAIANASQADKLFVMLNVILGENLAYLMSLVIVVLLLTYLITSADSAVLIINTINAGGDDGPKARPHILFWGIALALVVGGLIIAGGLSAIQTAMVIGALPFSFVMVLMGISLIVAIVGDLERKKQGLQTIYTEEDEAPVEAENGEQVK
jgi:choline/carnitine/betaine transport|tara:strand:+ start:920 stop:2620 length:1701 start_codon:yes stop_codon:yes gene_type:complete